MLLWPTETTLFTLPSVWNISNLLQAEMGAPDHMEAVCALFVANVVGMASCGMQTSTAELGECNTDDDDDGYGPDTSGT